MPLSPLGATLGPLGGARGAVLAPPLPNLAGWWKADALTLSDGALVSAWPDSSGQGQTAVQASSSVQPTYHSSGGPNGAPYVAFLGVNGATAQKMTTPLVVSLPYTILAVFNSVDLALSYRALTGTNNWLMGVYSSKWQLYNNAFIPGPAATVNVYGLLTAVGAGTGATLYFNGASQGSNAQTGTPGTLGLGGANPTFTEAMHGNMVEVLVYSAALSPTDRQAAETYLNTKYTLY